MNCKIPDCARPPKARGWCNKHWLRWWRHGDPLVVKQVKGDDAARFWAHVHKTETCWLWVGQRNANGYGIFLVGRSGGGAHRWAYATLRGPIPDGLELDHTCRVRHCVNPAHLEPVSHTENMHRAPRWDSAPGHGTTKSYSRGCRCDSCRAANTRYERGRRRVALEGAQA